MMSRKLINDFFNVDWYVLMHVKQSQARETFVAHGRPKVSLLRLSPLKDLSALQEVTGRVQRTVTSPRIFG